METSTSEAEKPTLQQAITGLLNKLEKYKADSAAENGIKLLQNIESIHKKMEDPNINQSYTAVTAFFLTLKVS